MEDRIKELEEEIAKLKAENIKLRVVADVAAYCCIDLEANLETAHQEYMAGQIPNGAFQHVLSRQAQMHGALYMAGYTETHKFFDFPVRPKEIEKETPDVTK